MSTSGHGDGQELWTLQCPALQELRQVVYGNGDPKDSLIYLVERLRGEVTWVKRLLIFVAITISVSLSDVLVPKWLSNLFAG